MKPEVNETLWEKPFFGSAGSTHTLSLRGGVRKPVHPRIRVVTWSRIELGLVFRGRPDFYHFKFCAAGADFYRYKCLSGGDFYRKKISPRAPRAFNPSSPVQWPTPHTPRARARRRSVRNNCTIGVGFANGTQRISYDC